VVRVNNGSAHNLCEELLQHESGLIIHHGGDALDAASACHTADCGLGNTQDVVTVALLETKSTLALAHAHAALALALAVSSFTLTRVGGVVADRGGEGHVLTVGKSVHGCEKKEKIREEKCIGVRVFFVVALACCLDW